MATTASGGGTLRKPGALLPAPKERQLRLEAYAEVERLDGLLHEKRDALDALRVEADALRANAREAARLAVQADRLREKLREEKANRRKAARHAGRAKQEATLLRRMLDREKREHATTRRRLDHAVRQLAVRAA